VNLSITRTVYIAYIAAAALALSACSGGSSAGGGSSSYGTGDSSLAGTNVGGGPTSPFLADGQAVLHALDAIEAKSGKPLRVTDMNADTSNGLTVEVQEPGNHANVDSYVIAPDGTMTGPTPVKIASLGDGPVTAADVDRQAFDPRAIGFAHLADTVRTAIAKSTFSDARVGNWEISGLGPDDKRYIYLDAARGRPVAVVNNDLKILKMQF
jgi:hypothetical protein